MTRPTYILAGGGTGGHLLPGLAVAEALRSLEPDALAVFAVSGREYDRRILDPLQHPYVVQPIRPFPRRPHKLPGFWRSWRRSMTLAKTLLVDLRPRAVLGLGGFAAGAIVRAAAKRHIPAALLNPDAVPGLANRYLAGRVDAIFTQFASTADCFAPRLRGRVHAVGCPVRPRLTDGDREEAIAHFGLRSDRRTLLVFGGSTLAASLSDAVAALGEAWSEFADDWQLLVVAGAGRREEVEQALSGRIPAVATDYCRRMDLAYAVADLALARGGAVTVAELASTGTPAVILPYPHHRDRQQYLNASELVRAGAAVVADDRCDADANAEVLRGKLFAILRDKAKHAAMQSAARSPGGSDAARGVAQWMVERQHGGA